MLGQRNPASEAAFENVVCYCAIWFDADADNPARIREGHTKITGSALASGSPVFVLGNPKGTKTWGTVEGEAAEVISQLLRLIYEQGNGHQWAVRDGADHDRR